MKVKHGRDSGRCTTVVETSGCQSQGHVFESCQPHGNFFKNFFISPDRLLPRVGTARGPSGQAEDHTSDRSLVHLTDARPRGCCCLHGHCTCRNFRLEASVSFFIFAAILSQWDFSQRKFGLPSPGKASCDRVALPNLRCMLGVLVFPYSTEL